MAYIAIGASVLMRRGFQDFRMIAPPFAKCSTTTLPITLPRCAMSIDCTPACSPICPVASRVDTEAMLAVLLMETTTPAMTARIAINAVIIFKICDIPDHVIFPSREFQVIESLS